MMARAHADCASNPGDATAGSGAAQRLRLTAWLEAETA
jgi:hypothetical protein